MKKIVVSTFNNSKNNYGAVFQSCALSAFLTKLGYDVSYVTIKSRKKAKNTKTAKIKAFIKKLMTLHRNKTINERIKKFRKFTSETQKQIWFEDVGMIKKTPPEADAYISGSDQVWNPVHIHEDFFLSYADKSKKKISYAASMGNEVIPADNKEKFAQYISEFDYISVREDTVVDIIKNYTDKPVHQHIDPVFLMDKAEWNKLAVPYRKLRHERYILVYAIEWNSNCNKELQKLKKHYHLPVVSISIGNIKNICADQIIYDASPNEFLYLLDGADFVVATSFHGTALSILYNKPFMAFSGKDKPTRINSLLRHFNIESRDNVIKAQEKIDFSNVNRIISADQNSAKQYLIGAIEG